MSQLLGMGTGIKHSSGGGGTPGWALDFEQSDYDYVSLLNIFSGLATGSIEAWIKPETIAGTAYSTVRNVIVGKASDHDVALGFSNTEDKIRLRLAYTTLDSIATITPGNWYHIVAAWDPLGMALYINGSLDNSNGNAATWQASGYSVLMARCYDGSGDGIYDGIIDELRLYTIKLSLEQVEASYNSGAGSYGEPELGLVAGYHLDEGEGAVAGDYSGNGYDGTIYGPAEWVEGKVMLP